MNEHHNNERPAKRQKLDAKETPSATQDGQPGYLTLARRIYAIRVSDAEVYKALLTQDHPKEVELVESAGTPDNLCARVRIPGLKTTSEIAIDHALPDDAAFLASCVQLRSTIKESRKAADQPLAQCHSTITIKDSVSMLALNLLWHDSVYPREKVDEHLRVLLQRHIQIGDDVSALQSEAEVWNIKEFYDNVYVPLPQEVAPLKLDSVQCKLYPFQDRATRWLLSREGVEVLPSGQTVKKPEGNAELPLDFREVTGIDGLPYFCSKALSIASSSRTDITSRFGAVRGGILAEAMGLGKTVEMITLMCSHSKQQSPLRHSNTDKLRETGATLIITPPTILEQWKQEIREHAPSLRVAHYTGLKSYAKRMESILDLLADQDVVLTTYSVIASEIHYVQEKPDRVLRNRPRREPPKSPLTQLLWWRCLLDEAQMVENGVSNAAIVARLIPRINVWAVTGTPLKQSHRDLYGLLLFLRYEPWCLSARLWDYLVFYHRPLFRQLIGSIILRHSKELVREELRIPAQSRKVVTMPFTAIEESHYAQRHYDMQQDCGFDHAGGPLDGEWDPDNPVTIEKMRSWLQRLRQTCLHPEVGGRNRKALGKRGGGPLRTVAQVLEVMVEQTDSVVHTERRNVLIAKADQARIFEHARQSQTAQDMFTRAYAEATTFVAECRTVLALEVEKTSLLRKDKAERVEDPETEAEDPEDDADSALTTAKQRLRSALEVQHICIFFIGNTYYQLKQRAESELSPPKQQAEPPNTDNATSAVRLGQADQVKLALPVNDDKAPEEDQEKVKAKIAELEKHEADAYEEAKKIRTELLAEVHRKATNRIRAIRAKRDNGSLAVLPDLEYSDDDFGGIESRKVYERLYHYCKAMNTQAEQFQNMRAKMTDMLCRVLIDEDEGVELTGEEYEDSTKHQDEMYVVMEMLRALFADRSDAISGQENLLLKQETKQFLRSAKEGEGPAPDLMIKLLGEREKVRINPSQQGSLRGILNEIRSLASSLEWQESVSTRAKSELVLVSKVLQHVQKLQAAQAKSINALEQEVNLFKDTMNARLDYYRALQVISDMVAPIGKDEDVGNPVNQGWVDRLHGVEETAAKKLSVAMSKRRYFLHLKNEQENEGEAKICTICQFEFEIGTLTVCGHQFCKECIQMWWSEHRNCPVCKRHLHLSDFYDVTYKPSEPSKETVEEEKSEAGTLSSQPAQSNTIYTTIPPATLNQIKSIELRGSSYGSKVDTLVRHILHLRKVDPGSKSIIFSQYRDFLEVLSKCLRTNDIIHSKFDDRDGIIDFKSNPANECFLLHAKAHAAGLNLVCASHVILCEPLINTAIELQAVARVHRIGQVRETCVWMYIIENTVEEAIYEISVKRRLAHMDSKSQDASRAVSRAATPGIERGEIAIEAANARELQAADLSKMFASGKTGGEMVDKEDLWECLFGNPKSDRQAAGGPSRGLGHLPAASASNVIGAGSEIAVHLRAEAADGRRGI